MKKLLPIALLSLFSASAVFAQDATMSKPAATQKKAASPHETIMGNNMKVTYGRPYKKGRDIFGGLEAYGKVWRTGADKATEITFDKDCTFIGRPLKAGTYTLFTIPGQNEWVIILNSQLGQWGAFEYEKNKDKDVIKAAVGITHLEKPVEQLTISIDKNGLSIAWDKTSVFLPVKF